MALHELGRAPQYMKRRFLSLSSLSSLPSNTNVRSLASVDKSIHQSIQPQYAARRTPPAGSCLDDICMASVSAVIPCMRSSVARELQRDCVHGGGEGLAPESQASPQVAAHKAGGGTGPNWECAADSAATAALIYLHCSASLPLLLLPAPPPLHSSKGILEHEGEVEVRRHEQGERSGGPLFSSSPDP